MATTDPGPLPSDPLALDGSEERDSAAFLRLYEEAAPALCAWAHARIQPVLRSQLDPGDLIQEICCRALERFASFDSRRGNFRSWTFGIANNVLKEILGKLRSGPPPEPQWSVSRSKAIERILDQATTISRRVARDENLQRIIERLDSLDWDEKRLLIYRGFEGLPHREIAELTGLSVANIEKRWQRLIPKLEPIISWETLLVK